jgi:all-trans-retinol 13,14-reductase
MSRQARKETTMSTAAEHWDAIVIGSGLGGLTAAAYLQTNGLRTIVLEQYDVAGGSSHVFRRKRKWEFDVGLHYLGDCQPGGAIPGILGGVGLEGKVEFLPMDRDGFDTLVFPDLTFRVPAGWDNYLDRLVETFPGEEKGLERCVGTLRSIARQLLSTAPPRSILDAIRFAFKAPSVLRWQGSSLADLFDACDLSERARAVVSGESGDYAAPPSRTSVMLHAVLIDHYMRSGGWYPRGGGQMLAGMLVEAIQAHGGEVRTRARVGRILVTDGAARGIELTDGERIEAPIVVSDADLKRTMLEMVGPEQLSGKTVERVEGYRMALPLFSVYLGLEIDVRERMPNTNFWVHPGYDPEETYGALYEGRLPDELPFYITSASVKDPDTEAIAPPGCSSLELITMVPAGYDFWQVEEGPAAGERYSRNPDYLRLKEEITERLIDGAERILGPLRTHIAWKEASTPITQERYTLVSGGSSYGLEHSPDQWGVRRPRPRTEIDGLYLAGASTIFGHGIAGVMAGGVGTASAVLKRDLLGELRAGHIFGDPAKITAGGPGWDPFLASRRLSRKPRSRARPEAAKPSPEPVVPVGATEE